jgi:predicted secreted Zn-dependent protease
MPRILRLAGIAALLGAFLCVSAAQAEIRSSVSYLSFAVDSDSLTAVARDVAYRAPQALRTRHANAETRIRYRWTVQYVANGGACVAAKPVVDLHVTIVLPDWRGARAAPQGQQAAWEEYVAALSRHEGQHHAIAVETAHELLAALRSAPTDLSCRALARLIDEAAGRIMAEERRRQTRFDRAAPFVTLY